MQRLGMKNLQNLGGPKKRRLSYLLNEGATLGVELKGAATAAMGILSLVNGRDRITGNNTGAYPQITYSHTATAGKRYLIAGTAYSDGVVAPLAILEADTFFTGTISPNTLAQPFSVSVAATASSSIVFHFFAAGDTTGKFVEFSGISIKEVFPIWING